MAMPAQTMKVTLLGTGSPPPVLDRFGPSTLIEGGTERIVIDVGRGASQRIWQLGIPLGNITAVFLTHLHSDHTVGIPDLWLTGWLNNRYAGRRAPFQIYGPAGTADLMANLEKAYGWDIRTREADEKLSPQGIAVAAKDVTAGIVFERNGLRVTAFDTNHGDLIKPTLGYRVDFGGHSVVLTGDTRPSDEIVKASKGADVMIHEVAFANHELLAENVAMQRIIDHHTSPRDAGTEFTRSAPKLAVYSHIVLLTDGKVAAPTVEQLVAETRKTYADRLEVGTDLMTITIGPTIEVVRPAIK
jgi:ribonuclease Z